MGNIMVTKWVILNINSWFEMNKLKLNENKTKILEINSQAIEKVNEVK